MILKLQFEIIKLLADINSLMQIPGMLCSSTPQFGYFFPKCIYSLGN